MKQQQEIDILFINRHIQAHVALLNSGRLCLLRQWSDQRALSIGIVTFCFLKCFVGPCRHCFSLLTSGLCRLLHVPQSALSSVQRYTWNEHRQTKLMHQTSLESRRPQQDMSVFKYTKWFVEHASLGVCLYVNDMSGFV